MLRVAPKGAVVGAVFVTPEEDRILWDAFERHGGEPFAREAAVAVVRHYQKMGVGQWILCDCRPDAERPPALVPVAQTHIRRHQDARWPVHCDACDFRRDPQEQWLITASHSAAAAARPMRLVRPFRDGTAPLEERVSMISQDVKRPGLARLLMRLVTEAGLQRIEPGWRPPPLVDQIKAMWAAAKGVEIDAGLRLSKFFCTRSARLGELAERIAGAEPQWFPHSRPHGVLIARVAAIGDGVLEPVSGEPIPVRGRLAVFGERAEAGYDTRAERAARAPYLAACLVGRASAAGPIEVLSAYAHPCAAAAHLMLVDSAMERRTLAQLRSLQVWLGSRKGVLVWIEKPLLDVRSEDAEGDPERAPAPPCLPDFVVRASRAGDEREATIIVETMGFADEKYRTRKDRTHAVMHAVLDGAPIVVHDFHQPLGRSQGWRDDRFWRDLRLALTGPEPHRDVRRGTAVASAGETTAAARVARRSEPPRASGSPARSSAPATGR